MKLLTVGTKHPKLSKSDNSGGGYLSSILHLSPALSSGYQVCPAASQGCVAACLNLSGRGYTHIVQAARRRKTSMFFEERDKFFSLLREDITTFRRRTLKRGLKPAIRLNGTSDIQWEKVAPELFTDFSDVQFYDYTKIYNRMLRYTAGDFPPNYHLTFSRSEGNHSKAMEVLENGGNVAVVFDHKELPPKFYGFPVNNADTTDLRFLDPKGVAGLYAKGRGKRDLSGFVVPTINRAGKRYTNYPKLESLTQ
jgi:hypothetical protein